MTTFCLLLSLIAATCLWVFAQWRWVTALYELSLFKDCYGRAEETIGEQRNTITTQDELLRVERLEVKSTAFILKQTQAQLAAMRGLLHERSSALRELRDLLLRKVQEVDDDGCDDPGDRGLGVPDPFAA